MFPFKVMGVIATWIQCSVAQVQPFEVFWVNSYCRQDVISKSPLRHSHGMLKVSLKWMLELERWSAVRSRYCSWKGIGARFSAPT